MFDTDICIYAIKGVSRALDKRLPTISDKEACVSVITYGELLKGVEKSEVPAKSRQKVERLLSFLPVMPLDEDVALEYGRIVAHLERKGTPIGVNDLWIGAHALSLGLTLITNNEREFKRIPKLKVENWAK